ncbi:hypothetical protein ACFX15_005352 [Malus domestica]
MGRSNCACNEITQVGHAHVRPSCAARASGIYSIVHNLMPARPKFAEELIKNVSGEAKKAQGKSRQYPSAYLSGPSYANEMAGLTWNPTWYKMADLI